MSRFFSERFSRLVAYVPGEQPKDKRYIKLNTNESPYPPSPEVVAALNGDEVADLRLYSDPECSALKETLANYYGVSKENVLVCNGSDEALNFAFMAFCDRGEKVSYPDISYGFYSVFADLYGLEKNEIPLREDFSIRPEDYFDLGTTIFIANPNAPTGLCLPLEDIESIVRNNPDRVVVIDEAYVDFGGQSAVALTKSYDNLLVTQTYSKSRCLAGARLGMAVGSAALISDLETLRNSTNPYNVNRLTMLAGKTAIESQSYFDNCNARTIQIRENTTKRLREMGFTVLDSKANFIFASTPKMTGEAIYKGLRERGILVRWFNKPRIKEYLRITIGAQEEMDALITALKELTENA